MGKSILRKQDYLIPIIIFCVIIFCTRYLGSQVGRRAALQAVQGESIAQNAPNGFMGAKWLMTMPQVKALFPQAVEFTAENLKLDASAFDRPAFIDFIFKNDLLIMIIISFKGEKTEMTYQQTHDLITDKYGSFPEPSSAGEEILSSKKIIGRVAIEHVLYQQMGMPIEQVMFYRTKNGSG